MTHSGRIEAHRPRSKHDPLNQAALAWRSAYRAACRHDDLPEDTQFAVFSKGNPFVQFVNRGAMEFAERMREYQTGGYVGLTIKGGKVRG